jgi:hypothetical protein
MSPCLGFKFLKFSFPILVKIQNSQFPSDLFVAAFQQHSSTSIKHISWTIDQMKTRDYSLEREWSPPYLFYSSLGLNPIPTTPILYYWLLLVVKSDWTSVSGFLFPSLVGRAEHCHLLLHKCTTILVLSLWLKSRPRDLISWHQKFSSIRCHQSPVWMCLLILLQWPHALCVDHSHLSSDLVFRAERVTHWFDQIPFITDFTFPLVPDQDPSVLPSRPASSCDCG